MKKAETSVSWRDFVNQLGIHCREQEVSLTELVEWVTTWIQQINKKTFDYYITSGPTSEDPQVKMDFLIVLDDFLNGFTVYKDKRDCSIIPIESILQFSETITNQNIQIRIYLTAITASTIEDRIENLPKLREFVAKVKNEWKKKLKRQ